RQWMSWLGLKLAKISTVFQRPFRASSSPRTISTLMHHPIPLGRCRRNCSSSTIPSGECDSSEPSHLPLACCMATMSASRDYTAKTGEFKPPPLATDLPPLLSASHISKTFPGQVALDDVSITINQGEIYGLVGQN